MPTRWKSAARLGNGERLTEAVAWGNISGLSESPGLKRKCRAEALLELDEGGQMQND